MVAPLIKPGSLAEAEAHLDRLEHFTRTGAHRYQASAAECADALAALADLRAWLDDLSSRRRIAL